MRQTAERNLQGLHRPDLCLSERNLRSEGDFGWYVLGLRKTDRSHLPHHNRGYRVRRRSCFLDVRKTDYDGTARDDRGDRRLRVLLLPPIGRDTPQEPQESGLPRLRPVQHRHHAQGNRRECGNSEGKRRGTMGIGVPYSTFGVPRHDGRMARTRQRMDNGCVDELHLRRRIPQYRRRGHCGSGYPEWHYRA